MFQIYPFLYTSTTNTLTWIFSNLASMVPWPLDLPDPQPWHLIATLLLPVSSLLQEPLSPLQHPPLCPCFTHSMEALLFSEPMCFASPCFCSLVPSICLKCLASLLLSVWNTLLPSLWSTVYSSCLNPVILQTGLLVPSFFLRSIKKEESTKIVKERNFLEHGSQPSPFSLRSTSILSGICPANYIDVWPCLSLPTADLGQGEHRLQMLAYVRSPLAGM